MRRLMITTAALVVATPIYATGLVQEGLDDPHVAAPAPCTILWGLLPCHVERGGYVYDEDGGNITGSDADPRTVPDADGPVADDRGPVADDRGPDSGHDPRPDNPDRPDKPVKPNKPDHPSKPEKTKGNNGWGNGSQDAPGKSGPKNNAENGPKGKNDGRGKDSGNSGKGKGKGGKK